MMRKLCFLLLLVCITVFAHAEDFDDSEKELCNVLAEKKEFHIPFTFDERTLMPVIEIQVENETLRMGINLFGLSKEAEIYTSFMKKMGLDYSGIFELIRQGMADELEKSYIEISDDDIITFIDDNRATLNVPNVFIEGELFGTMFPCYSMRQEEYDDLKYIDGMIGTHLFWPLCDNVVIDYKNCEIVVNAPPLPTVGTYMKPFWYGDAFRMTVSINGVEQDAVIAPALSAVYLRDEINSSKAYSDREIIEYCKTGKARKPTDKYKNIVVQVDGVEKQCKGYFSSRKAGEVLYGNSPFIIRKTNLLGYPVFKGRRIQLDFKNWVFRMD